MFYTLAFLGLLYYVYIQIKRSGPLYFNQLLWYGSRIVYFDQPVKFHRPKDKSISTLNGLIRHLIRTNPNTLVLDARNVSVLLQDPLRYKPLRIDARDVRIHVPFSFLRNAVGDTSKYESLGIIAKFTFSTIGFLLNIVLTYLADIEARDITILTGNTIDTHTQASHAPRFESANAQLSRARRLSQALTSLIVSSFFQNDDETEGNGLCENSFHVKILAKSVRTDISNHRFALVADGVRYFHTTGPKGLREMSKPSLSLDSVRLILHLPATHARNTIVQFLWESQYNVICAPDGILAGNTKARKLMLQWQVILYGMSMHDQQVLAKIRSAWSRITGKNEYYPQENPAKSLIGNTQYTVGQSQFMNHAQITDIIGMKLSQYFWNGISRALTVGLNLIGVVKNEMSWSGKILVARSS